MYLGAVRVAVRRVVHGGAERDEPGIETRGVFAEDLDRGARLAHGARGAVVNETRGLLAAAADHGTDFAGLRVNEHDRGFRV